MSRGSTVIAGFTVGRRETSYRVTASTATQSIQLCYPSQSNR